MKKLFIVILIPFLLWEVSFSQVSNLKPNQKYGTNDGDSHTKGGDKSLGFWVLPHTGAGSPAARIPGNVFRFQRGRYLVRASEISSSGFPIDQTIDAIGFNILDAGVGTQTGHLKIYMKNTTDVTNTLGTGWNTEGFTLVCDIELWTVPIEVGPYVITFSGGSSFTYTGDGVYVAFEFSNPTGPVGTIALSARCNTNLDGGINSSQNNNSLPTTMGPSGFRPQTQFVNASFVDVVQVEKIYTLEKVAVGYSPTPIDVLVTNVSSEAATFDVTVTVEGLDNSITYYSSTETVTNLAAGTSMLANFAGWNPTEIGDVSVTAEATGIPEENWLTNNILSIPVNVNTSTLSYTYDNSDPIAFGYNYPNSGIFAAKYIMKGASSVTGANIVIANHSGNPGNTIYAVLMNSSGAIIDQSANYVIQAADLGTTKSFTFPSQPSFGNNEVFYIGLAQTTGSGQWRPLGTFDENPQRLGTFFDATLAGGSVNEIASTFRKKFGLEAVIGAPASCLPPTAPNATNITQTSATISWTPNEGSSEWEYVFGPSPLAPPTESGTATTSNLVTLSGLSPGATYQFYVRSNCGSGEFSAWAGPFSFSTLLVSTPPFFEGFATTAVPTGWSTTGWLIGATANLPPIDGNYIYRNLYGTGDAQTGTFTTVDIGPVVDGMFLTFDYALVNWSNTASPQPPPPADSGNFVVSISTDFGATWTEVQSFTNNGVAGWQSFQQSLASFAGQIIKVIIFGARISGDYWLAFDNFSVGVDLFTVTFDVKDSQGDAITNAVVTLGEETNQAGDYGFVVEPGYYNYTVTANGFIPAPGTIEVESNMLVPVTLIVDNTSVTDPSLADIKVFPVPARTVLNVTSSENMRQMQIVNMLGQVIYSAEEPGVAHEINLAEFREGIYLVRITTDLGVETRTIQVIK